MQEVWVQSLGWGNPLEKEMAILSSVLAWKIPWSEGLGGLQSMRSQRVKYRVWHDSACIEMQLQCRLALSFLLLFYSCITSDLLIWFSTRQGVPSGKGPCLFFKFIYFWLCWVFVAAHRRFLVAVSWDYSSFRCVGFSLWWFLLQSIGSRHRGFSSCNSQDLGHRLLWLWCMGFSCPQHVESSWTRDRTCVPCFGRRILSTVPPGKSKRTVSYH